MTFVEVCRALEAKCVAHGVEPPGDGMRTEDCLQRLLKLVEVLEDEVEAAIGPSSCEF